MSSKYTVISFKFQNVTSTKSTETAMGHKFDITKTSIHFWRNGHNSTFWYKTKTKLIIEVHRGVLHF